MTNKPSAVAVLGGTGRSGKFIIEELIRQGYMVKMLIRSPEKAPAGHPSIEQVLGSARNHSTIQRLLTDCDAVVSALGPSKGETDVCSVSTRNITSVMRQINIRRYIEVAGLGLTVQGDRKRMVTRIITWAIRTFSPATVKDRQRAYEILMASQTDWTIVRCPNIEMTGRRNNIKVSLEDNPGLKLSAADLAGFIVSQLSSNEYFRKCPFIASKPA